MLRVISPAIAFLLTLLAMSVAGFAEGSPQAQLGEIKYALNDWPCWRGPHGNGVADAKQSPPLGWSNTENVVWKVAIPGRGHSSPIVIGDRVIITTAEEDREIQSVL